MLSFSEGFEIVYIATGRGGVYRWHSLRKQFLEPVTTAQGLMSNTCQAVYYDQASGILWVVTPGYLEYSYDAEGTWIHRSFEEMGLSPNIQIDRMGSSKNYLWLFAGSRVLKMDRVGGNYLGQTSGPDEPLISMSSGSRYNFDVPEKLREYSVTDGWLFNGNDLIDIDGRTEHITTIYFGKYNDQYLGTDRGTLLIGDGTLESFQPIHTGLLNSGVGDLLLGREILLGGSNTGDPSGLTWFNPAQGTYDYLESELEINLPSLNISRMIQGGQDVWVGGNDIVVYNLKDEFWKSITKPVQGGRITGMCYAGGYLWMSTDFELMKIDTSRNQIISFNVLPRNLNTPVYGIASDGEKVFVVSDVNFYSINPGTNELRDERIYRQLGLKPGAIRYEAIQSRGSQLLLATTQGIYYRKNPISEWKLIINPTLYGAQKVRTLDWDDNLGILNLGNHLVLFTMDGLIARDYSFDFIGKINCTYIDHDDVWLGTTKGLIQFNWKNERLK
ncbi:MAG: hypothetical protein GXO90_06560 [FCB group bacterium]|nr:hypothetical protein [FCB group bacterium]